ncbi:MAG: FAD-binding oxidoreductase, partial [Acidimicrobiales bacterium]
MSWRLATVSALRDESESARTLVLDVPGWPGHLTGQHVDVRLTAADGYTATRSYSVASAPAGERVELTIERLPDGEVSPYLTTGLALGDPLELRGP